MKHVQSNEPQIHAVLQDYIFCVVTSRDRGLLPLTQSEAGAWDQEIFVENYVKLSRFEE